MPSVNNFEVSELKLKAEGQWPTIISRIGIGSSFLDGSPGPCPKCGGRDRWRTFSDFEETGGAVCNQCGKFADGISLVEWFCGCEFGEALAKVASELGIESKPKKRSPTLAEKDPNKHFEKLDWNETVASFWIKKKTPISVEALKLFGAVRGRYRKSYPVIGLPVIGENGLPGGWCFYHATGKELPFWTPGSSEPQWAKIKIAAGTKPGWIGSPAREGEKVVFKLEGPSDALALASLPLPADCGVVTNPFGAGEDPLKNPWMLERFRGKVVYVIHDCDGPGQDGALEYRNGNKTRPGWAKAIATVAKEVRNVVLPYPIEQTHGKDLRDWIREQIEAGHSPESIVRLLFEMCEQSLRIQPPGSSEVVKEEDPIGFKNFLEIDDDIHPKSLGEIFKEISSLIPGKLICIAGTLSHFLNGKIRDIESHISFMTLLRTYIHVDWRRGSTLVSQQEAFEYFLTNCEKFECAENLPHFGQISGIFYLNPIPKPGDESALDDFASFFSTSSDVDSQLIKGVTAGLFANIPAGKRAAVLFVGQGPASGKTAAAEAISRIAGGCYRISRGRETEELGRHLINLPRPYRVILLDNVRGALADENLEAFVTSEHICGHRLFKGGDSRKNHTSLFITMNAVTCSKDFATRLIRINFRQFELDPLWDDRLDRFISEKHDDILRAIAAFFARKPQKLSLHTRWPVWDREIVGRLSDPDLVIRTILSRQEGLDSDRSVAEAIEIETKAFLRRIGMDPMGRVHIYGEELAEILTSAIGEKISPRSAFQTLDRLIESKTILSFERNPSRTHGRGFVFGLATTEQPIDYSIREKISEAKSIREEEKIRMRLRVTQEEGQASW